MQNQVLQSYKKKHTEFNLEYEKVIRQNTFWLLEIILKPIKKYGTLFHLFFVHTRALFSKTYLFYLLNLVEYQHKTN